MADDKEYVSKKEFNIERDRLSDKISTLGQQVAVLETVCASMRDLPQTIQNLDKTMALMEQNLKSLNDEFKSFVDEKSKKDSAQSKEIERIDNKSKFDFMNWVKSNFVTVVMFLVVVSMLIKDFIK